MLIASQAGCEIKNYLNIHLGMNTGTFSEGYVANQVRCLHKLGAKQLCTQVNVKHSQSSPLWEGSGFEKGLVQQ